MMEFQAGEPVVRVFTTRDSTGVADADSLPTGTLVLNGVDDGAPVDVVRKALGSYSASVTLPAGHDPREVIEIRIQATVDGVTEKLNLLAGQVTNMGPGSGAIAVEITVDDGTDPIQGATVTLALNASRYTGTTDEDGFVVLTPNEGLNTYEVRIAASGYQFTPVDLDVDEDPEVVTYSMTATVVTPSAAGFTTCYLTVFGDTGLPRQNVPVILRITALAEGTGQAMDPASIRSLTDADGLVEFPGMPQLAAYEVKVGQNHKPYTGTTTAAATTPLVNALGQVAT